MSLDPGGLIGPVVVFAVAAGAPGPATLAVAATAMARGRRAGLAIGAGLSLGLAFWGVVAATGLGALILTWTPALAVLRLAGGAVLLWLAWRAAQGALRPQTRAPDADLPGHVRPLGGLFRAGLVLNLLNPKALLAWGAVIAIGLPKGAGPDDIAWIVAASALTGALIYALYAWLFALGWVRAGYRRARRAIEALVAAGFGLAGLRLLAWRPETASLP